jgi:hypothetical protein
VLAHLHTKQPAPAAYLRYVLMKEFGWTPEQVRAVPLPEILEIFVCMNADTEYQNRPRPSKK